MYLKGCGAAIAGRRRSDRDGRSAVIEGGAGPLDPVDTAVELHPGHADLFHVHAGQTLDGIDVVMNRTIDLNNFGQFQFFDFAALQDPAGNFIQLPYIAVRVPADRFAGVARSSGAPILAALFLTAPTDPSVVLRFPRALLTTGTVHPDGTRGWDR